MKNESTKNIYVANIIEEARLGGPQKRIVAVANQLENLFKTVVFMPDLGSEHFQELCSDHNVKHKTIPLTGITKQWKVLAKYTVLFSHEIANIYREFRQNNIRLVHVSGGSWQYKGLIAARLAGIPVIWHLNDTQMPILIRWAFRVLRPLATGFIFASERTQKYYRDSSRNRPQAIIPAPVDISEFNPEQNFQSEEDLVDTLAGSWTLGVVANINPVKGLETAIRTLATLNDKNIDTQLLIVGPVFNNQIPYYHQLLALAEEQGVSDRIHWIGGRKDVRPLYQLMDLYICSSRAESSPMSVWEAMAMKIPVVSTDVGDVPRHVMDGKSGFIVPVADHEAMADRIEQLISDDHLRRSCATEGRRIAVENFSVQKVAEKTQEFYRLVLANSGKPLDEIN